MLSIGYYSIMAPTSELNFGCFSLPLLLLTVTDVSLSLKIASQSAMNVAMSLEGAQLMQTSLKTKARDRPSQKYYRHGKLLPPGTYPYAPEPVEHNFILHPESRVLVAPKYKLAFCFMEKNACTEFNALFNMLNGINIDNGNKLWWKSTARHQNVSLPDLTAANGWKWGVFLRDPVKRYLSGWASKCFQKEENVWNCRPDVHALVDESMPLDLQVHRFEEATRINYENRSRMTDNPHWAQQTQFCSGIQDLSKFDFVGLLEVM